jgi:hypothetical protein
VGELSNAFRGRNSLTQVLFDWLMGMSLERTGIPRLGSDAGGVSGILRRRVIVPSGLWTI